MLQKRSILRNMIYQLRLPIEFTKSKTNQELLKELERASLK